MMSRKLGIAVTTEKYMDHVLGFAQAAQNAGIDTEIFFTGDGVHVTQDSRFEQLLGKAKIGICEVSYFARGYRGVSLPGISDKDFVTQGRNAEMVEECDRYLIL